MGTEDIKNVEDFLRKQQSFIKNEGVLEEYNEFAQLNNGDYTLAYRINENEDWFETNKNIVFSIIMENNLANRDFKNNKYFDAIKLIFVKIWIKIIMVRRIKYGFKL